ncbi:uncharacterized protein EI97DRAFT_435218 [Westerdykella ornata]|uniref:Uncharacterized protein n=1 Tax=Westerdykella ornata TaxID=318751 RepID=A0A6A6JDY5_WESOR|nr:uncharacterized protein EI97DRAFT_435218 [Westerdykella ornata]KAF2274383.1 hypothetical protein EI97DRAFT_435218 [Westerdykella ornata]
MLIQKAATVGQTNLSRVSLTPYPRATITAPCIPAARSTIPQKNNAHSHIQNHTPRKTESKKFNHPGILNLRTQPTTEPNPSIPSIPPSGPSLRVLPPKPLLSQEQELPSGNDSFTSTASTRFRDAKNLPERRAEREVWDGRRSDGVEDMGLVSGAGP